MRKQTNKQITSKATNPTNTFTTHIQMLIQRKNSFDRSRSTCDRHFIERQTASCVRLIPFTCLFICFFCFYAIFILVRCCCCCFCYCSGRCCCASCANVHIFSVRFYSMLRWTNRHLEIAIATVISNLIETTERKKRAAIFASCKMQPNHENYSRVTHKWTQRWVLFEIEMLKILLWFS